MQQTKTYRKYKENSKERFVRYSEGAEMYHISVSKFMQMAKDATVMEMVRQCEYLRLAGFILLEREPGRWQLTQRK